MKFELNRRTRADYLVSTTHSYGSNCPVYFLVLHEFTHNAAMFQNQPKVSSTLEMKQENFKALVSQVARPFLTGRTDWFVNEVERFLASGLNIEAHDKVYAQHLGGWKLPGIATEDEETEFNGHEDWIPYLYLFDNISDEIE